MSLLDPYKSTELGDFDPDVPSIRNTLSAASQNYLNDRDDYAQSQDLDQLKYDQKQQDRAFKMEDRAMKAKEAEEWQFDPTLSGEDAIKHLSSHDQVLTRAIANYEIPHTALGRNSGSPKKHNLLTAAKAFNPDFDIKQYDEKAKMRTDFASGARGKQVNNARTLINHLGQLSKMTEGLNNTFSPLINRGINAVETSGFGDARYNAFDTVAKAATTELAALLQGGNASVGQQTGQEFRSLLHSGQSPAQIKEGIAAMLKIAAGRVSSLQDEYSSSFRGKARVPFFRDKEKQILQNIGGGEDWKNIFDNDQNPQGGQGQRRPQSAPQGSSPQGQSRPNQFIIGKVYNDANGKSSTYKGRDSNGKDIWQ